MTDGKTIPNPLGPGVDQVEATRRLAREMENQTNKIIDRQVAASTPMTPKR
jgi:hypothetical protein